LLIITHRKTFTHNGLREIEVGNYRPILHPARIEKPLGDILSTAPKNAKSFLK